MPGYATSTLTSIPFADMIGGPMTAAVQAQLQAAMTTVDFITAVGFKHPPPATPPATPSGNAEVGEVRTVTFSYVKKSEAADAESSEVVLTVPLLTIVPIPYLKIDELSIDFTANITEAQSYSLTDTAAQAFNASVAGSFSVWVAKVKFAASYSASHKSERAANSRYQTNYTMNVSVKASQDDLPGGMAKVLSILEQTILEKPASV